MSLTEIHRQMVEGLLRRPSFAGACPLCKRPNCAKFLGNYHRTVVTEDGTRINKFPVFRYQCTAQRRKLGQHRTFSLLPAPLIPYRRPSQHFVMAVMKIWSDAQLTLDLRLERISHLFAAGSAAETLGTSHGYDYAGLLLETGQKLSLWKGIPFANLTQIVNWIVAYSGGAVALSLDYYAAHGSFKQNSQFLFGTPSQFRGRPRSP